MNYVSNFMRFAREVLFAGALTLFGSVIVTNYGNLEQNNADLQRSQHTQTGQYISGPAFEDWAVFMPYKNTQNTPSLPDDSWLYVPHLEPLQPEKEVKGGVSTASIGEENKVESKGNIDKEMIAYITFYDCVPGGYCGNTYSGVQVAEGHAACDRGMLGRRFKILGDPTDREYICADTGSAVNGDHVDIFFYKGEDGWAWIRQLAQYYADNYPEIRSLGTYALIQWED